jgi:superfamily II DNA/RNA helicase
MNNIIDTKEILSHLKLEQLNQMQEQMIQTYDDHEDLVLLSPTGSGKTLAYLLPLVAHLQPDVEGVQAVVLVPSRELALQTTEVFKSMGTPFKAVACYGGRPAMDEHRMMNNIHPQVVVGTPGRMNDHLTKENIDVTTVRTLVIDEFDKCLELGFQDEMAEVLGKLPDVTKHILLSATEAEEIPNFVGMNTRSVNRLDFLPNEEQTTVDRIRLFALYSPEKDKLETLYNLLCTLGSRSSLVFVNYRESVERVGRYLQKRGVACEMFHGGMEQRDRERALYKFSNGSCNVFVSTDLASRGLDIPDIDSIIHYHLPLNEEAYIHRNGRTARWEAEGNSFMIIGPEEQLPEYAQEAQTYNLPATIPAPSAPQWVTLYIGKGKKDKINKVDVLGFLCQKGNLSKESIGKIDVKEHHVFVSVRKADAHQALAAVRGQKIKGLKTIIELSE